MTKAKGNTTNVEEELLKRIGDTPGNLEAKVKLHDWLLVGVVVVVVVSFAAMLITVGAMITDSLAEKKATSQSIRDEVKLQNSKIDALADELKKMNEQKSIQVTN